jgi:hypothetical protein
MELYGQYSARECRTAVAAGRPLKEALMFLFRLWMRGGTRLSRLARLLSLRPCCPYVGGIPAVHHPHSTPTPASQPAFQLPRLCPPLPLAECHARSSREAYASCLAPVHTLSSPFNPSLSLYLRTSVPNTANDDVAAPPVPVSHPRVRAVFLPALTTTSPPCTCVCLTWTSLHLLFAQENHIHSYTLDISQD